MAANIWMRLRGWLRQLFDVAAELDDRALMDAESAALKYYDSTAENMTALIANALSTLACGDADVTLDAGGQSNERADLLSELLRREWAAAKHDISAGLGVGMIATIPYCIQSDSGQRKIYTSTVTRDRIYITGVQGSDITQCVVLADVYSTGSTTYYRWTAYKLDDGAYVITNKATCEGRTVALPDVPQWANIPDEIRIAGVDRLPIGFFRCPTANRRPDDITGVPITFGCDATLRKIARTLEDIEAEYDRKKVRILADRTLLRDNYDEYGNVIRRDLSDDLFVRLGETDNPKIDIFDPQIRTSAYYDKLQQHFALLEKQIGVSRGILTDLDTKNATATEIRRAMYQTFCLLDDIHREYERYLDAVMYGINIMANYCGLGADTDYSIKYDWSYALLEDSNETFAQLMQGYSAGAISPAEIRMFLRPDDDLQAAEAAVAEIKQGNLLVNDLLGMSGGDDQPED